MLKTSTSLGKEITTTVDAKRQNFTGMQLTWGILALCTVLACSTVMARGAWTKTLRKKQRTTIKLHTWGIQGRSAALQFVMNMAMA